MKKTPSSCLSSLSNPGSLWHKGAYNTSFPYMEANYPYAVKNLREAEPLAENAKRPNRFLAFPTLVLYGKGLPIIGPFRAWKPTILMT